MSATLQLPAASQKALAGSLQKYSGSLGADWVQQALDRILSGLKSALNPADESRSDGTTAETGASPSTVRADVVSDLLNNFKDGQAIAETLNLDFKISTALDVAGGAGRFVQAQSDVDEYPAWALSRMYARNVPRGFKAGPKGAIIPVPDDDWPSRWEEAGNACGDDDWLPWDGDSQTGRGIALKSSGIWEQLGSLRDDSLGNAFPPFAFNSGFDVDGVPYKECVELGLLDDGDKPEPADVDLNKLFSPIA
ncbi:MAG TPA: hypothetical protein VK742_20440 [Candidatus Sulfotelmatobacter sp.]|jgi:hypothetical protein|nr:hypothetical protein [Candidatus Sulfotelmatobacter sp.]